MEGQMSRHHLFNPDGMPLAVGFSYGALAERGRTLHIAGMTGHHPDGSIEDDLVDQFGIACQSVSRVIGEAGGEPSDLISMTIYTTDVDSYRRQLRAIGERYRRVFGKHYPPMALLGVTELFDPSAAVELVCVAVVPE